MFDIHMLCADHGDCLWVEYGNGGATRRMLVDAGTPGTYERSLLPKINSVIQSEGRCIFELFVITHIDADHIGGALRFLDELDKKRVKIREIWFNGYFHLSNESPSELGPTQGEMLTELIRRGKWPWNKHFGQRAVMVPDAGPLPSSVHAGMKLTLLSPTFEKLQKLKPQWGNVVRKAGLVPGAAYAKAQAVLKDGFLGGDVATLASSPFKQDRAPANGSSIAFVAEFDGIRALFGADAHPSVLVDSLKRTPLNGSCRLDAFKLPHHGSRNNVSLPMLDAFPAERYLISTNGNIFQHPDEEALARVVIRASGIKKKLCFNYETDCNRDWNNQARKKEFKYTTAYGKGAAGLIVRL